MHFQCRMSAQGRFLRLWNCVHWRSSPTLHLPYQSSACSLPSSHTWFQSKIWSSYSRESAMAQMLSISSPFLLLETYMYNTMQETPQVWHWCDACELELCPPGSLRGFHPLSPSPQNPTGSLRLLCCTAALLHAGLFLLDCSRGSPPLYQTSESHDPCQLLHKELYLHCHGHMLAYVHSQLA